MSDIRKTIAEIKEGLEGVTPDLIERAAVTWCSTKKRETFSEDVAYFRANWNSFDSLREFVERERDICRRHTMRAIIEHVEELEATLKMSAGLLSHSMADEADDVKAKDARIKELEEAIHAATRHLVKEDDHDAYEVLYNVLEAQKERNGG